MTEDSGRFIGRVVLAVIGIAGSAVLACCGLLAILFAQAESEVGPAQSTVWAPGQPWLVASGLVLCASVTMMMWSFWAHGGHQISEELARQDGE